MENPHRGEFNGIFTLLFSHFDPRNSHCFFFYFSFQFRTKGSPNHEPAMWSPHCNSGLSINSERKPLYLARRTSKGESYGFKKTGGITFIFFPSFSLLLPLCPEDCPSHAKLWVMWLLELQVKLYLSSQITRKRIPW